MPVTKLTKLTGKKCSQTLDPDPAILLNHLPCTGIQTNPISTITFLGNSWYGLTGYNPADCIGTRFHRYVYPDDHDQLGSVFTEHTQITESTQNFRFRCIDKRIKWVRVRSHLVHDKNLGFGIIGIVDDISQHIGREASLLANHRTLSELLNDFQGMVFRCQNDADWTMQYVSAGALKLTGYRPRDIINNTRVFYNNLIVDSDQESVWSTVQSEVRDRSAYDLFYSINTASEGVKRVWERGKGIYSENNDLHGLEGFVTNISCYEDHLCDTLSLQQDRHGSQSASETYFHDWLSHRHQRYLLNQQSGYAVIAIHIDKIQRYREKRSVSETVEAKSEILKRLISCMSSADTIFYRHIQDIKFIIDSCSGESGVLELVNEWQTLFRKPVSLASTD